MGRGGGPGGCDPAGGRLGAGAPGRVPPAGLVPPAGRDRAGDLRPLVRRLRAGGDLRSARHGRLLACSSARPVPLLRRPPGRDVRHDQGTAPDRVLRGRARARAAPSRIKRRRTRRRAGPPGRVAARPRLAGRVQVLAPQTAEAVVARHRVGLVDETFGAKIDWGLGVMVNSWYYRRQPAPYGYG